MKHLDFSASSASRWMTCLDSINHLKDHPLPEEDEVTARGTRVHEYAEKLLTSSLLPYVVDEEELTIATDFSDTVTSIQDGLSEHVSLFEQFGFTTYRGVRYGGTADAILFDDDELHIIDLKTGYKHVEVVNNEQLMIYALNVLPLIEDRMISSVTLHIYRQSSSSEASMEKAWTTSNISMQALSDFQRKIEKRIDRYLAGESGKVSGDHCLYCNKAECPLVMDEIKEVTASIPKTKGKALVAKVESMSSDKLLELVEFMPTIKKTVDQANAILLARHKSGKEVKGMKLIQGLKNRSWKSEGAVKKAFGKTAVKEVVISPAQLEKKVGAEKIEAFTERKEGSLKLVKLSAKGDPVKTKDAFAEDVKELEQETNN